LMRRANSARRCAGSWRQEALGYPFEKTCRRMRHRTAPVSAQTCGTREAPSSGWRMTTHRVDLLPLPKRHGRTPISPIYAAARWPLDNGLAWPDDIVETYRGEMLCMSGKAGELAKWTVEEAKHGNPSLVLRRWKVFETWEEGSPAAETAKSVYSGIPAPEDASA
jgi:hypothetical protein